MLELVVVKTEETKIFTCLIKCLIAGCLWTKIFVYFHLKAHRLYTEFQIASLLLCFGFLVFFFSLGWCTAYCHSSVAFCISSFVYCPPWYEVPHFPFNFRPWPFELEAGNEVEFFGVFFVLFLV